MFREKTKLVGRKETRNSEVQGIKKENDADFWDAKITEERTKSIERTTKRRKSHRQNNRLINKQRKENYQLKN